jgi:hypothetical protein
VSQSNLLILGPFPSNPYSSNLVCRRSFLGGCAIVRKPAYLTSLYKRGGAEHSGLSKRVGSMERFLVWVRAVTLSAMALSIAQHHVSVLRGAR